MATPRPEPKGQMNKRTIVWGAALLLFVLILFFWFSTFRGTVQSTLSASRSKTSASPSPLQKELETNLTSLQQLVDRFEQTVDQGIPKAAGAVEERFTERLKERITVHATGEKPWTTFEDRTFGFAMQYPSDWTPHPNNTPGSFLIQDTHGAMFWISKPPIAFDTRPLKPTVRTVTFHGIAAEETTAPGFRTYTLTTNGQAWLLRYEYEQGEQERYNELWRQMNVTFRFLE